MNDKVLKIFICGLVVLVQLKTLAQESNPTVQNLAYADGEYLKYSINYGFVTGGYVTFTVEDTTITGVQTNKIRLFARSAGVVDALYKIRDQYVSYVDESRDQPLKSIRNIREGRYRYYNEVTYDYENIQNDSITINSQRSGEVLVPTNIQDILSAFYYARKFDFTDRLNKGQILEYTTYFGDEIFPLRMKYIKTETIKTNFGKVKCFLFYPVTEVGRAFETEEDMQVWISKDENRIPVKVKVNIKIGSFTCELEEYNGLHNAFSSLHSR